MFQRTKVFISFSLLLFAALAQAGEISQVKGDRVLLDLQGTPAETGSEFYGLDANNKRKVILRIRQVRGDRAIAEIVKGTPQAGMQLREKTATPVESRVQDVPSAESPTTEEDKPNKRPRGFLGQFLKRGTAVGILGGYAQNTMSLTAKRGTVSEGLSLKGSSFSLLGFYDYDFSKSLTLRSRLGLETFSATASASNPVVCSDSSDCNAGFNYLSGEVEGHYNFSTGSTKAWVGLGLAFMFTMSKSTSVSNLDTSSSTNQMYYFSGGADIALGRASFIPVSIEYGMYPGGAGVTANSLFLRAGYGWRY